MILLYGFRKKDIKFLQRIEMHKQLKEQREQEKKYLLNMLAAQSRKNVKIIRDPIRFLIPTVEWRQKLKKNNKTEPAEVFHKPVTITNIPHLYVYCKKILKKKKRLNEYVFTEEMFISKYEFSI